MKREKYLMALTAILVSLFFLAGSVSAQTVELGTEEIVGDSVFVPILIINASDFPTGAGVSSFQTTITFDSTKLTPASYIADTGSDLPASFLVAANKTAGDTIKIAAASEDSLPVTPDTLEVAVLAFERLAFAGTTDLTFTEIQFNETAGGQAIVDFTVLLNNLPFFTSDTVATGTVNSDFSFQVTATDGDGDAITYSFANIDTDIFTTTNAGLITAFPLATADFVTTVTATDARGDFSTQDLHVKIFIVNDPPVFINGGVTVQGNEGKPLAFQVQASDPDDNPLKYTYANLPTGMTGDSLSGIISGTPTTFGTIVTDVTIDDQNGGAASTTYTFIIAENEAPVIEDGDLVISLETGAPYFLALTASDPENDQFSWSFSNLPTGLTGSVSEGTISGTPTAAGTFNSTVTATDVIGKSSDISIVFTVGTNNPPIITGLDTITVDASQDAPFSYEVQATDIDEDAVTISFAGTFPAGVDTAGAVISGTPTDAGTFFFTITATDAKGAIDTAVLKLVVAAVNRPPVFDPTTSELTGAPDAAISIDFSLFVTDTDGVGDTTKFSIDAASVTAGMAIDSLTGVFSWTSPVTGDYTVTVTATDTSAATATHTLTLTITGDTTPAIITTTPTVSPTTTTATVSFDTDEAATAQVGYRESGETGDFTYTTGATLVLSHQVEVTGLSAATIYEYSIIVTNEAALADTTTNPLWTFRTLEAADETAPVFFGTVSYDFASLTDVGVTIIWTTDEDATSVVHYGTTSQSLTDSVVVNALTTEHRVALTGLTAATEYFYTATSADASGNSITSDEASFTTAAGADETAPVIIIPPFEKDVTTTSAVIEWETNEPSTSVVNFRSSTELVFSAKSVDTPVTVHTVPLTGLTAGTEYSFYVQSADAAGNTYSGDTLTFTTNTAVDVSKPQILAGPEVTSLTDEIATILWKTDKTGDSRVDYGTTTDLFQTYSDPQSVQGHLAKLTKLTAGTKYYYQVRTTAANDSSVTSAVDSFTTESNADVTGPVFAEHPYIFYVLFNRSEVAWSANEPHTGVVNFGTDSLNLTSFVVTPEAKSRHVVNFSNLTASTKYYYKLTATDLSGNTSVSNIKSFWTPVEIIDTIKYPVFISRPNHSSVTNNSAIIEFTADEPVTAVVNYWYQGPDFFNISNTQKVTEFSTSHAVALTNLEPGTEYSYSATITNKSGNQDFIDIIIIETPTFTTGTAADETAPEITKAPFVDNVTESKAIIKWTTNEKATSTVEYDTLSGDNFETGFRSAKSINLVTDHEVALTGLVSSKRYFYRVRSADVSKNTVSSGAPLLSFYTDEVVDETAPTFIGAPFVSEKTHQSAIVEWTTDEAASSFVEYGKTTEFRLGPKGNAAPKTNHKVVLTGLEADSTYFLYVRSQDQSANTATSDTISFTTDAVAEVLVPVILSGPDVNAVTNSTAEITWTTDKASDSFIEYGTAADALTSRFGDGDPVTNHRVVLTGLTEGTRYFFKVTSTDIDGNAADAMRNAAEFRTETAADTDVPVITNGPIVFATGTSAAFEWRTDEAANSVVYYTVSGSSSPPRKITSPDLTKKHQVTVTGLALGTQYVFAIASSDLSGNTVVFPEDRPTELEVLYKALQNHAVSQPPGGFGNFQTAPTADNTAPAIINGPFISNKTANTVTITWETDERSNTFVDYGETDSYGRDKGSNSNVTDHSITLTNLTAASTYQFMVKSSDLDKNGPTTSANMAVTTLAESDDLPPVITGGPETASVDVDRATIAWDTDEPSDTKIEFHTTNNFYDDAEADRTTRSDPDDVTNHSITLTNLTANTTYYYRVSSTDLSDNGPTTKTGSFMTTATADATAPVVTEVMVSNVTNTSATVTWTTDELANSYVDYGMDSTVSSSKGGIDLMKSHSMVVTNLTANTMYYYRVGSTDQAGNASDLSAIASFTTAAAADTEAPVTLTGVDIEAGNGAVYVSWTASTEDDLKGYNIYRKTTGDFSLVASNITDAFYYDRSLTNETAYTYTVSATDRSGNESVVSSEVTATPNTAFVPTKPTLTSPAAGVTITNTKSPALVVTNSTSTRTPVTYEFMVATDMTFLNVVKYQQEVAETAAATSFTLDVNLDDGDYYWRVRAHDGVFFGPWSDAGSFSIEFVNSVELVGFEAFQDEAAIRILWETALVTGSETFVVYRSLDRESGFEKLDFTAEAVEGSKYEMNDGSVEVGRTYFYRLTTENEYGTGETLAEAEVRVLAPKVFKLHGNYPNPFNPETTIKFELPAQTRIKLTVYNILGQEVVTLINEERVAGFHIIKWDGRNTRGLRVSSGMYIYRLEAGEFVKSKKMLLIK